MFLVPTLLVLPLPANDAQCPGQSFLFLYISVCRGMFPTSAALPFGRDCVCLYQRTCPKGRNHHIYVAIRHTRTRRLNCHQRIFAGRLALKHNRPERSYSFRLLKQPHYANHGQIPRESLLLCKSSVLLAYCLRVSGSKPGAFSNLRPLGSSQLTLSSLR